MTFWLRPSIDLLAEPAGKPNLYTLKKEKTKWFKINAFCCTDLFNLWRKVESNWLMNEEISPNYTIKIQFSLCFANRASQYIYLSN